MAFSTNSELRTLGALRRALDPLGYMISQKVRVLDAIEAVAAEPAGPPIGPKLGEYLLPAMRAAAGPLHQGHPWLHPGDWRFAFCSHFDFVVHAPMTSPTPTLPLFAVEFDGPSHADTATLERDCIKNRLCAASGLPLVRLDNTHLQTRDRLSIVEWLASLWAARRDEMPGLLADRDADLASMDPDEKASHGRWLLAEHPALDVDFMFALGHRFPPTNTLALRLVRKHGLHWGEVHQGPAGDPRWRVASWTPIVPSLDGGLTERWSCKLTLAGPDARGTDLSALSEVRTAYPLEATGDQVDSWDALGEGRLTFLPAGPWIGAPSLLGEALCRHNALVQIEQWLWQHDK